jgi:hypothetical protein
MAESSRISAFNGRAHLGSWRVRCAAVLARSPWLVILSRFAATRVALFAVAAVAIARLPIDGREAQGFHLPLQPHAFLEAWARYDACWYVAIARLGYRLPIGPYPDMRANFFPLFPALVAALTPLAGNGLLAGLIVSNVCCLVFLLMLWTIVRLDWGAVVADRAVWIYLLFPSAFFLSGAYSESVLLAATAGALLAARRRRWWVAGVCAGLATLARPVGVVAVVPLLVEWVTMRRSETPIPFRTGSVRVLLAVVGPTLVAGAAYLAFAAWVFGQPLAMLESQASVRGAIAAPWQPFIELWRAGPRLHSFDNSLVDAVLAVLALATVPVIFTRVRASYAWYALFVVLIPLSGSLISFNRLLLPSFPHAILLARFATNRRVFATLLVAFAILQGVVMAAFATWHWVA